MGKKIKSSNVFQFKITLNDSKPKIWRRILVPANYTFFDLYCAIENAMGWAGGHLHAFYIDKRREREKITIEFPNPEGNDPFCGDARDERKELIADYFGKIIKQCTYCYDFGDNWGHTILFERVVPREPKMSYPQCVAGENACPPEDCGGVGGYEDLQKIVQDPNHAEHADMMDWLCLDDPKEFDPRQFDLSEVYFENPRRRLAEWNRGFRYMPKNPKAPTKFSETKFYFDDCPICRAMKKAEEAGKNPSLSVLKKAFAKANKK